MKQFISLMILLTLALLPCACPAEDAALFPARGDNGLWGYIDRTGSFVIEPRYVRESPWMGQYAAVTEDGVLWGIVDAQGHTVLPPEYVIFWAAGGRAMGVIDADSPEMRPEHAIELGVQISGLFDLKTGFFTGFRWKSVHLPCFDTSLIPVLGESHLWGYADLDTGEQIIPCRFTQADDFHEGWAVAQLPPVDEESQGPYVLVSAAGEIVYPPEGLEIEWGSRVSEGLISVRDTETETAGYMDVAGRAVIPPQWDETYPFHGNFAAVTDFGSGRYRYIDRQGNVLPGIAARPESNGGYEFVNGLTSVFADDPRSGGSRPGAMNEQGRIVFTLDGENVFWLWNFMDNGLAWYMEWHPEAGEYWYQQQFYGLADREGNKLTDSIYACTAEEGSPFSEGLAAVFIPDNQALRGYIDETGNWAIASKYAAAYPFSDGLAYVKTTDGRCGYIDHSGEEVYMWHMEESLGKWDKGLPE